MALTKTDIVELVQKNLGMTKNKSGEVIEDLLEIIKETLASGEDVMISNFGRFCFSEKNPRMGRNPATGESMLLEKRRVVTFKCSGNLKDKINNGPSEK